MRGVVEKGKKAWEEKNGKAWTTLDLIEWIKAWKEGDSYEREYYNCFTTYGTFVCSIYVLLKSVILDNVADEYYINDESFFIELNDLDELIKILIGDKVSEYRQVGIVKVPIRKPESWQEYS